MLSGPAIILHTATALIWYAVYKVFAAPSPSADTTSRLPTPSPRTLAVLKFALSPSHCFPQRRDRFQHKLCTLVGAVIVAVAASQDPGDVSSCMIPPGFPLDKLYHPLMNPTANGTFQELAIEWYNEVSNASDTNDLGQGIYDICNKPTNDKFQWRSPWPRDDATKEFKIRYCYMDGASKSSIMAHFEEAIIKILANMGGQPSQATGYGIRFEETVIDGKYEFCRDPNPTTTFLRNSIPESTRSSASMFWRSNLYQENHSKPPLMASSPLTRQRFFRTGSASIGRMSTRSCMN